MERGLRRFLVQPRAQNRVICEIRTSCLGLHPVGFENLQGQRLYNLSAVGAWFVCPDGDNCFPLCTSEPVLFELWPIVSYPPCTTPKNLASSLQSLPGSTNGLLLLSVLKPSFLQAKQTQLPQPPLAGAVLQPPPSCWPSFGLTSTYGSKCWDSMQGVSSPVTPWQRSGLLCHICDNPSVELHVWTICMELLSSSLESEVSYLHIL